MYKVIMFDLDGTITDSGKAIMTSVSIALSRMGYENEPEDKLRTFIGPSLFDSFKREYPFSDEEAWKAVDIYRKVYGECIMYEVTVYDGIPELLKTLREKGFSVYLITSKPIAFSSKIIEHIGLSDFFTKEIGPDLKDPCSDKERLIKRAIEEDSLKKEECLMIGDTFFDIKGAVLAGVDSVGVTYGFGLKEDLIKSGATYIADSASEIPAVAGLF